jgi:hypothetical protein
MFYKYGKHVSLIGIVKSFGRSVTKIPDKLGTTRKCVEVFLNEVVNGIHPLECPLSGPPIPKTG